jgi:nitrogen fixation NifU-like protein
MSDDNHSDWQPSPALLDHMHQPRNNGWLLYPDGHAHLVGDCGDEMAMWVKANGDRIERIVFVTSGCGTSHAAGSMATVLATGRSIQEAMQLTQQEVLTGIGGLPKDHEHCALLAATTVQLACEDVLVRRVTPVESKP